jgi:hypothetical protein
VLKELLHGIAGDGAAERVDDRTVETDHVVIMMPEVMGGFMGEIAVSS